MGINRKINRKKKQNPMLSVSKDQKWHFDCDDCKNNYYQLSVKKIHKDYFLGALHLIRAYELFIEDLLEHAQQAERKVDVIEFLEDSVENNYYLNDSLSKQKFLVEDDHIYTHVGNRKMDYIHTGEFIIDNYKVNVSFSYMFFTDLTTNEQFMYYGD